MYGEAVFSARAVDQGGEGWEEAGARASTRPEAGALLRLLIDELAFGIAIVDARRRLLLANRLAERQIVAERFLMLSQGILEGNGVRESQSLQKAVDAACEGRRSHLVLGRSGVGLDVIILPLCGVDGDVTGKVAIVTEKCVEAGGLGLYNFCRTSRLTRAEERLLGFLSAGISVAAAAARAGCAPNTARAHVRSLLAKTGQPTLRALTGWVGRLPPVATRAGIMADAPDARSPALPDALIDEVLA